MFCGASGGQQRTERWRRTAVAFATGILAYGGAAVYGEFPLEPDVAKPDGVKRPTEICRYGEVQAACRQLLVYLARPEDAPHAVSDVHLVREVLRLIADGGGRVVGRLSLMRMLQVEVDSAERLVPLREALERSPYVERITYNLTLP